MRDRDALALANPAATPVPIPVPAAIAVAIPAATSLGRTRSPGLSRHPLGFRLRRPRGRLLWRRLAHHPRRRDRHVGRVGPQRAERRATATPPGRESEMDRDPAHARLRSVAAASACDSRPRPRRSLACPGANRTHDNLFSSAWHPSTSPLSRSGSSVFLNPPPSIGSSTRRASRTPSPRRGTSPTSVGRTHA